MPAGTYCSPARWPTSPTATPAATSCARSSRPRIPNGMASGSPTISPDAVTRRFAELRAAGRRAFVPYITAGHPDEARTVELISGLEAAGADAIELGLPFSDPMADGPVIQASSQLALERGMTFDRLLDLVSRARATIPLILFSYVNPVLAAGDDALARAA